MLNTVTRQRPRRACAVSGRESSIFLFQHTARSLPALQKHGAKLKRNDTKRTTILGIPKEAVRDKHSIKRNKMTTAMALEFGAEACRTEGPAEARRGAGRTRTVEVLRTALSPRTADCEVSPMGPFFFFFLRPQTLAHLLFCRRGSKQSRANDILDTDVHPVCHGYLLCAYALALNT